MDLSSLKSRGELSTFAPGRINLLGEHTDYNEGYVLPAAIEMGLTAHFKKREGNCCRIFSEGLNAGFEVTLDSLSRSTHSWQNYFLGVLNGMARRTGNLGGFDAYIEGSLPAGAGVSSSAALECSFALGLNELFGLQFSRQLLLEITREADREYVGVQSGPMDQYTSLFGKKDHFLLLDCRELRHEFIPTPPGPYRWVLLNSGVTHALAEGAYNKRREECRRGVAVMQQQFPLLRSLRDATPEQLEYLEAHSEAPIPARCRYVVAENERVLRVVEALRKGDWDSVGKLMYQTHEGLRDLYAVSCPEIDFLVARSHMHTQVLGARIMGGGFGGCTLNLVHEAAVEELVADCTQAYKELFGRTLAHYVVSPSDGARVL